MLTALATEARSYAAFPSVEGTEDVYAAPGFAQEKLRVGESDNTARRAFTYFVLGTAGMTYVTAGRAIGKDLLDTMNASADVLAMANVEINLDGIAEGDSLTLKWRGKPLFVRHRTAEEITQARNDDNSDLKDPQADEKRVKKAEWLVLLGICTHLGCVPLPNQGDYHGYFCPCHGSHYDTSGRIRKGPAPLNLEIPPYVFKDEGTLLVGVNEVPA